MKIPRTANAVGHIDEELILVAAEGEKSTKRISWHRWRTMAACFAVFVIAGTVILPLLLRDNIPNSAGNRYEEFTAHISETAIVWPWEYRSTSEKYSNLVIDDVGYLRSGREVPKELIGQLIGTYTATGYDEFNDKNHTMEVEVYQLQNVAQNRFVAVKLDDSYYVFSKEEYDPPNTLGELLEQVDLPKVVKLNRFSEKRSNPGSNHFVLNDDDYVWEVLFGCKDAPFIDDQLWSVSGREYLSFSISSETLGIYRNAMYVTEDGYLWTNAFRWQYLFYIGEEAAGEILRYAKKNSTKAEYEPYQNAIIGTVVDITGDHILVDDSNLCKDPTDGITYKVSLSDIRIARYVNYGVIKVGDMVQVSYEGDVDAEKGNTLENAVSISKVVIQGKDVLIPE